MRDRDLHLVVHDTELNVGVVFNWLAWVLVIILVGFTAAAL